MFDNVSPSSPFYFVGCLDIIFAIACVILGCLGVIRNDIADRKIIADEILAKKRKVEQELTVTNAHNENRMEEQQPGSEDGFKEVSIEATPSYSIQ